MPVPDMARQRYLTCVHSSLDDILAWILATVFGTDFILFVDRMATAIKKLTAAFQSVRLCLIN
jgi:arginine repressor